MLLLDYLKGGLAAALQALAVYFASDLKILEGLTGVPFIDAAATVAVVLWNRFVRPKPPTA